MIMYFMIVSTTQTFAKLRQAIGSKRACPETQQGLQFFWDGRSPVFRNPQSL